MSKVVILSETGISAESGIDTFRDSDGCKHYGKLCK
jgi:NAD-dependent SIR2 family protein deacetylase